MANFMYNSAKLLLLDGGFDLSTSGDTIKAMLVEGHTADPDDDFVDDVNADEISVTGYTGGFGDAARKDVVNITAVDNTLDLAKMDGTDITWSALGAGATINGIILIKENTNDADSDLLFHIDVVSPSFPTATDGSDFVVTWNALGIVQLLSCGGCP